MKTQVFTLVELTNLLPNLKKLNEIKFNDQQELLKSLIKTIEESGEWEFVQYIPSGKPTLFVVRKIEQRLLGDNEKSKLAQFVESSSISSKDEDSLKTTQSSNSTSLFPNTEIKW